jgi:hypothetical protein
MARKLELMLAYWFLFLIPASLAASRIQKPANPGGRWPSLWILMYGILVLAIGLRHEVGADWFAYVLYVLRGSEQSFTEAVSSADPAYIALNWLAAQFGGGPYFVNTACAAIFAWGLVVFCRAQPRPWLTLVVAMPYLVTVVAMGYTRQGVAIGAAMLALAALSRQRIFRFVIFVVLAATFHKSAVILMPLAILAASRKRIWTATWVGATAILFYILLLQDSIDTLNVTYIEAEYASSGAGIRVAMNAMPAALFLLLRRRFLMSPSDRSFWSWMSLGAMAFVGLLVVSPSSTAVDRVALYWIPLQLIVLSRLPEVLGTPNGRNDLWVCVVVAYSSAVLFIWLFFADNAFAWLPYQFYPWVALWN